MAELDVDAPYAVSVRVPASPVGANEVILVPTPGGPGDDGADGVDGTDGTDGTDGASAYEIAVANGFIGTEPEWLESLVGESGSGLPQLLPPAAPAVSTTCYGIPGRVFDNGGDEAFYGPMSLTGYSSFALYCDFEVGSPITVTDVVYVLNQGPSPDAQIRLGIYAADEAWQPTTRMWDSGNLTVAEFDGLKEINGLSVSLPAGRYLSAIKPDGAAMELNGFRTAPRYMRVSSGNTEPGGVFLAFSAFATGMPASGDPWIGPSSGHHPFIMNWTID